MQSNHPDFKKTQTSVDFLLGPIKIKDGLFLGDQLAARDIQFIITNKVTHIINTVSKAIPNLYERFGVQYLSVHWSEKEQNIFDRKNNAVNAIFSFVEQAMELGQCCLIHSLHGKTRSSAVLAAYLMNKYSWSLNKTLELIRSKKEGLQIRNNYLLQMQQLQKRMLQTTKLTTSWKQINSQQQGLLANTFLNAKKMTNSQSTVRKSNKKRVGWEEKLVQKPANNNNLSATMTRFKQQQQNPTPKKQVTALKSILKGFPNEEQQSVKYQKEIGTQQKIINNINANIVHVTVNNFISSQKKNETTQIKAYNTRPFSSDTKDREKKPNTYDVKVNKTFGYDTFSGNIKNAYEEKIMNKLGTPSNLNNKNIKKKEELKVIYGKDRPESAKGKNNIFGTNMLVGKEELMVNGLGGASNLTSGTMGTKRRVPGSIPKQQVFKLK